MKIAIVTGSNGNLGRAVVNKFLKEGYRVVGTVRRQDSLKKPSGDHFEEEVVDVAKEEEAKCFVEKTIRKYGSIDAAVLTVGGFGKGSISDTGTKEMVQQYQVNFATTYNIAQPVFVQMIAQQSGRIFLIGSRPGLSGVYGKGMVAYGLSKSLIFRLAELMNEEGSTRNVVTSVIVPSTIDTPENREFMPGSDYNSWVKPETIADVIYFYCTSAADALREPVIKVYSNV